MSKTNTNILTPNIATSGFDISTLQSGQDITLNGNVKVDVDLDVPGATTLTGDLDTTGNASFQACVNELPYVSIYTTGNKTMTSGTTYFMDPNNLVVDSIKGMTTNIGVSPTPTFLEITIPTDGWYKIMAHFNMLKVGIQNVDFYFYYEVNGVLQEFSRRQCNTGYYYRNTTNTTSREVFNETAVAYLNANDIVNFAIYVNTTGADYDLDNPSRFIIEKMISI